jgi:hypothetical protein
MDSMEIRFAALREIIDLLDEDDPDLAGLYRALDECESEYKTQKERIYNPLGTYYRTHHKS